MLAGTEPNGILYRITAKDKAFVLYDANLPEIRAIVPMPDGTVYAAALGGSIAKLAQSAAQAGQGSGAAGAGAAVTATITVEAQAGPGGEIKPPAPNQAQPAAAAPTPQVSTQFTPVVDASGVDKSALYRINPDNTVETLWSSKEENIYDVLALERQVLFATDQNGRIYDLSPDRHVTLLAQTNESETTRLLPGDHSMLAATGNMGRIFRLGDHPGAAGNFEAPPHDSGTVSRWGGLSWHADVPPGCALVFRTRSGNSANPDRTWSEWSEPLANAAGSPVSSPNARYIQWKAELTGANGGDPDHQYRYRRLSAAEFAAGGAEHQRHHPGRRLRAIRQERSGRLRRGLQRHRNRRREIPAHPLPPVPPPRRCRGLPCSRSSSPGKPTTRMATAWSIASSSVPRMPPSGCRSKPACTTIPSPWMAIFWRTASISSAWWLPTARPIRPPARARPTSSARPS